MAATEGTLTVTPQKLISTSVQFGDCGKQLQTVTQNMLDIANTLKGSWQSPAAEKYYSKMTELEPIVTKILGMVTEHADELKQIGESYDRADADSSTAASALNTSTIV